MMAKLAEVFSAQQEDRFIHRSRPSRGLVPYHNSRGRKLDFHGTYVWHDKPVAKIGNTAKKFPLRHKMRSCHEVSSPDNIASRSTCSRQAMVSPEAGSQRDCAVLFGPLTKTLTAKKLMKNTTAKTLFRISENIWLCGHEYFYHGPSLVTCQFSPRWNSARNHHQPKIPIKIKLSVVRYIEFILSWT